MGDRKLHKRVEGPLVDPSSVTPLVFLSPCLLSAGDVPGLRSSLQHRGAVLGSVPGVPGAVSQ